MNARKPTQAMPEDGLRGAADGTNPPADERSSRPASPEAAKKPGEDFQGGQSVRSYHGSRQLGDQEIEREPDSDQTDRPDP